jgi:hypothetical protein
MIQGQLFDIPTNEDGTVDMSELRRECDVDPSEMLVEMTPAGENYFLPKKGNVSLLPNSELMKAPLIVRGD